MVFFDFFKKHDINAGVREYEATPGGVLLDVPDFGDAPETL